jgi:hypothetical protein
MFNEHYQGEKSDSLLTSETDFDNGQIGEKRIRFAPGQVHDLIASQDEILAFRKTVLASQEERLTQVKTAILADTGTNFRDRPITQSTRTGSLNLRWKDSHDPTRRFRPISEPIREVVLSPQRSRPTSLKTSYKGYRRICQPLVNTQTDWASKKSICVGPIEVSANIDGQESQMRSP